MTLALRTRRACAAAAVSVAVAATGCSSSPSSPAPPPTPGVGAQPSSALSTPSAALSITPPVVPSRAPDRDFPIRERTLDLQRGADRPLRTTVWYPTEGDGPFPLVLFSHGLKSEPDAYASVLRPWARAGFVVAAPEYPFTSYRAENFDAVDVISQPADAAEVITRVLALNDRSGDPLEGRLDPTRVAAAGHSAGGVTTIGMFSGNRDDRLTAGIVLSGRRVLPVPFQGTPAPMLFVHGKKDRTVAYEDGLAAYDAVPWPKAMMAVTEGGHVAITKDFDPVIRTTTDFLRWTLYGDERARSRLPQDAERGNRATLTEDW